jgi:GTP-binding protein
MTPRPIVAVVGKPNVGKSSLFNRLVGRPRAIVHDQPGVTRDRHYADVWAVGRSYVLIDTGGFDLDNDDPMGIGIRQQVTLAVSEADVVLCVFDARTGMTDADREAVAMPALGQACPLRRQRATPKWARAKRSILAWAFPGCSPSPRCMVAAGGARGRHRRCSSSGFNEESPPTDERPSKRGPQDRRVSSGAPMQAGRPCSAASPVGTRARRRSLRARRDPIDTVKKRRGGDVRRHGRHPAKGKVTKEADVLEGASVFQAIRAMERCDIAVLLRRRRQIGAGRQILGLAVDRGRPSSPSTRPTSGGTARKQLEEQARDKLTSSLGRRWYPSPPDGPHCRTCSARFKCSPPINRASPGRWTLLRKVLSTHPPPTK